MRAVRLFVFFAAGLFLGGFSVWAAASSVLWSSRGALVVRLPNGAVTTVTSTVPWGKVGATSMSGGGAALRTGVPVALGGARPTITIERTSTAAQIATAALPFVKRLGPAALAVGTLAPLIWDAIDEQWEVEEDVPEEPVGDGYEVTGVTVTSTQFSTECRDNIAAALQPLIGLYGATSAELTARVEAEAPGSVACNVGATISAVEDDPQFRWVKVDYYRPGYPLTLARFRLPYAGAEPCPEGQVKSEEGQCVIPGPRPATDLEIYTRMAEEMAASNSGGPQLDLTLEQGGQVEATEDAASGPASVPGPETTATTNSDAGTSTEVTSTSYGIIYSGNTATVTETKTKTNTDAAGNTTIKTETSAPPEVPPGEEPQPEEPPPDFCELHPDSIVCQQMDTPPEEKPDPLEREFSITPTGGFGGGGSCPSDVSLSYLGEPVSWSFRPACDFFEGVRPAVIAMAWVAAILIALGGYRKGD